VIERLRQRLRGESGYSLVEMLTVMVIMSVVFAGITDLFVAGSKAQADQSNRFQAQLDTRLALDKMRRDIHCASTVSSYSTTSVSLTISGCSGGNVSWCTAQVGSIANRYALYRQLGTSCSSGSGTMIADYLVSGAVFPTDPGTTQSTGCGCLKYLSVDFKVSVRRSQTVGAYELTDSVYLRNSVRT
jgi:prepilin-type N-terminal cleavage/methylation domain-containing protein